MTTLIIGAGLVDSQIAKILADLGDGLMPGPDNPGEMEVFTKPARIDRFSGRSVRHRTDPVYL